MNKGPEKFPDQIIYLLELGLHETVGLAANYEIYVEGDRIYYKRYDTKRLWHWFTVSDWNMVGLFLR